MKVRLIVALTLLICSSAWAAPPQEHQYIVKLKYLFQQPNASAAAPLTDVVTRGGGQVDYEGWDRLVVTLPDNAAEAVAKHQSTKYMQLVRSGPPASIAMAHPASANSGKIENDSAATPTVGRALSAPLRTVPTSSSTWDSGTYVYDGAGNITSIGSDTFTYDPLSRLSTSSIKGNAETYTYDQFGNLIYKTTTPAQGPALPVDLTTSTATNHLSAQPYDTAGNLKGTAGTELNVYDPFNVLREKDVSGYGAELYLYNANDERIAVISNPCGVTPPNCAGALITVSGRDEDGHVLRQFDIPYQQFATGSAPWLWLEDYVYRDGLLLAAERETAEGGRRHFHLDHLGSPRLVTGAGGARIASHDYYPFGVEITPLRQETLAGFDREEPMKFTGHERDFNIGVLTENTNYNDYMHARSTVAQWGRFTSVDRGPITPKQPQSWNRYSYVGNNPVRRNDPSGLCTFSVVCRNWGHYEENITVVGKAPPLNPMAAFLDMARHGASAAAFRAQWEAKAAATYAKMMSGRSDYIAPSNHEMLIALPGAMALARIATATATTTLFRAVATAESDSIGAARAFTPSPSGTMFKGFFYTAEDAHSFAATMARATGEEYSVFSTTAPTDLVLSSPAHAAAGEGAGVYIANENLGLLTPPTPVPPP